MSAVTADTPVGTFVTYYDDQFRDANNTPEKRRTKTKYKPWICETKQALMVVTDDEPDGIMCSYLTVDPDQGEQSAAAEPDALTWKPVTLRNVHETGMYILEGPGFGAHAYYHQEAGKPWRRSTSHYFGPIPPCHPVKVQCERCDGTGVERYATIRDVAKFNPLAVPCYECKPPKASTAPDCPRCEGVGNESEEKWDEDAQEYGLVECHACDGTGKMGGT